MKNNTKLIMETWRRFLNEDSLDPDLDSGFSPDDDSRPTGQSDSEDDSEGDYFDDVSQGVDDRDSLNGIDEPIDGEPPFDSEDPVESEDFIPVSVEVEVAELLRTGGDVSQYSDAEIAAGQRELEAQMSEENTQEDIHGHYFDLDMDDESGNF
tara:strand:- start:7320 stop:7778 length:459 start_codon:yes stop_codon:yes gene_type:complete